VVHEYVARATGKQSDLLRIFKGAVLAILAVIAKQERVRLSERTLAGLARARREGRVGGRPKVVFDRAKVERLHQAGKTLQEIATKVGVSKSSVHRIVQGLNAVD